MNCWIGVNRVLVSACAVSIVSMSCSIACAAEVAGVTLNDTVLVANERLKLNGAGIRHKEIFKLYVAGIYLRGKKTAVPAIIAAPGAKRIAIVMLRDLSGEALGREFMSGIQQNTDKAEKTKLIPQLLKFGEMFASIPELKMGDALTLDWVPGSGTLVQLNGKKVAEPIPDGAFYDALLRIWLGENPGDAKLKQLMRGESGY